MGAATSPRRHRPTLSVEPPDAETVDENDAEADKEDDEGRVVVDEPSTPAAESARKARASLDAARSVVARLNSPRGGESRVVVPPSAMKPPPSPATRGAEAAGSEVARNFIRGAASRRGNAGDASSPVARGLAMFDSPA